MSQKDFEAKNKNSIFDKLSPLQPFPFQPSLTGIKFIQNRFAENINNKSKNKKEIEGIFNKAKENPQIDL
jgi:hypothetical protein